MSDTAGEVVGHRPTLVAALLVAVLALPSLRAYVVSIPRSAYSAPIVLLVLIAVGEAWRHPAHLRTVPWLYPVLTAVLCLWLMVSSAWTVSSSQYQVDLILLAGLLVMVFSAVLLVDPRVIDRFLPIVCVVAALAGLVVVAEYALLGSLDAGHTHLYDIYLTIAHLLGLAATGAAIRFLTVERRSWLWGGLALLLFVELGLSLARGALLSSLAVVLLAAVLIALRRGVLEPGFAGWRGAVGRLLLAVMVAAAALGTALQVERTRTRLLRLFSGSELEEGGRGEIWRQALANIREEPILGHGLSSNGLLSMGLEGDYPHNLLLQVWLDGGLPAIILLIVLLAFPFLTAWSVLRRPHRALERNLFPLLGMYAYLILEYSKSENFYAGRGLFLVGVCIIVLVHRHRRDQVSHA